MTSPQDSDLVKKNRKMGLTVLAIVFGMIGLSFASVPLYRVFCQVTGFGGTTQTADILPDTIIDRTLTVQFNADTSPNLPWVFEPEERKIDIKIGQKGLTAFFAMNKSVKPTAGTAVYNVTPLKVGKYFTKVQCFCFDAQTLRPNEEVSMPVMFFVDPAFADDPNMEDVKTITLSYTFFPASSEELDAALETFYNTDENIN